MPAHLPDGAQRMNADNIERKPAQATPRPRRKRILLATLLVTLLCAVGLEIGARILARSRGKASDAETRRAEIESLCKKLSHRAFIPGGLQDDERARVVPGTQILQPYTGWEHLSTQELIVRGSEHFATERADQAFDICILGGSVAQSFADRSARLVELLKQDARFRDREVLIHNYACAGYKQPQQLLFLSYLLALGHEPDLVIELDGFNDAALAWANRRSGVNPAYPYLPFWSNAMHGLRPDWEWAERAHATSSSRKSALAFGEWFLDSGLWRSSFLGQIGMLRLTRLNRGYLDALKGMYDYINSRPKDAEVKGPTFASDDTAIAESIVRVWEESSINMQGICAQQGIAYLHVLQPTLKDHGSKPLTEKEISLSTAEPAWVEGVERLYPMLRERGSRLAERGVSYFDATGVFKTRTEDLYVDVCHMNPEGNELLAEAILDAVLAAITRKN